MVARQFWVVARCLIAYQKSPMSQVTRFGLLLLTAFVHAMKVNVVTKQHWTSQILFCVPQKKEKHEGFEHQG